MFSRALPLASVRNAKVLASIMTIAKFYFHFFQSAGFDRQQKDNWELLLKDIARMSGDRWKKCHCKSIS